MRPRTDITIEELRAKAAQRWPSGIGDNAARRKGLKKHELIEALRTGVLPARERNPFDDEPAAFTLSPSPVQEARVNRVSHGNGGDAAAQVASAIAALMASTPGAIDADGVEAIARRVCEELLESRGQRSASLSITVNDVQRNSVDGQHPRFGYLMACAVARVPVMLIGPAGSGKTTAAHSVSTALGLPFYALSLGPQSSKSDLLGFISATGEYRTCAAREAYEHGGVLLLDEVDAANAGVLTALNALLANGRAGFPDKPEGIERHPDFIVIAAANTFGLGADRQYVGRNQLDAATLDRFFNLDWNYDSAFERELCGLPANRVYEPLGASNFTPETWLNRVQSVRNAIETAKIRHVVSPRASLYGVRLLDVLPAAVLEAGLLWKGVSDVQRQQIQGAAK